MKESLERIKGWKKSDNGSLKEHLKLMKMCKKANIWKKNKRKLKIYQVLFKKNKMINILKKWFNCEKFKSLDWLIRR
jgi:hypothetical protein